MGIEDGEIKASQLSTSSHETISTKGRLNHPGAWVPKAEDTTPSYHIDLLEPAIVSGVDIQGYDYNGKPSNSWVTEFAVECRLEKCDWQQCGVRTMVLFIKSALLYR